VLSAPFADRAVGGWLAGRSCWTATIRPVIALINPAAAVNMPGSVRHQLRA